MKRSEINQLLRENKAFIQQMNFHLPAWSEWSPKDWEQRGPECREIAENQLGWDVTDFGGGRYNELGLFLFTIRNGSVENLDRREGKIYAEKLLIVQEKQVTPMHFHFHKMEDIINRGGGNLVIELWNSTADEELADTPVTVSIDGVETTVPAGGCVTLKPGDSICLPQGLYHAFWGEEGKGTVLVGEVSMVNDDNLDNRFHEPIGRFPAIEEDEAPLHLLCTDYPRYYKPSAN